MKRSASQAVPGSASDGARVGGEPALPEAAEILARVAADEAAADEARERYRLEPMTPIPPGARVAALLEPGEVMVASRSSAVVDRREPRPDAGALAGLAGELYVTSRRLMLLGRIRLSVDLDEIEEAVMSGERLLLALRDGKGLSIETTRPRLLRVEIATARASARD